LNTDVDFFVTLDKQHFLGNAAITSHAAFPIGTPGECLAWIRRRLLS
jgi:hypothetical protein